MQKYFLYIILILKGTLAFSQIKLPVQSSFYATLALGTHIQRLGLGAELIVGNQLQLRQRTEIYYNINNLGPNISYWETKASWQVNYGFIANAKNTHWIEQIPMAHYNTNNYFKHSIGYAYNYYKNTIGTSQITGTLTFKKSNWTLCASNDIFAKPLLDRFRTGAIGLIYSKNNYFIGGQIILWTGETGGIIHDDKFPSRHGYRDMKNKKFAYYSHGIANFICGYSINSNYFFKTEIGLDAQQIRHWVQNKLIHDMYFLPKKFSNSSNAHIPMLDTNLQSYLFHSNQKIKQPKLYFQWMNYNNEFY